MPKSKLLKISVELENIIYSIEGIPPHSGPYILSAILKKILKEDLRYFKANQKMDLHFPIGALFNELLLDEIKQELLALTKVKANTSDSINQHKNQEFILFNRFNIDSIFLMIGVSSDFVLFCKVLKSSQLDPWTDLVSQLQ